MSTDKSFIKFMKVDRMKKVKVFYLVAVLAVSALLLFSVNAQAVSEEAKRHFDRGMAAVEMAKSPDDYAAAIKEFTQAARLAPDWPDVYYNLGMVQEKAEEYSDAITSLKQYLRLAPNASDAETVKTLINKLEYKRDRSNIEGIWMVDTKNELAVQCTPEVCAIKKGHFLASFFIIWDIQLEVRKNAGRMEARVLSSNRHGNMPSLPDGPYVAIRRDGDMVKIFDAVMYSCNSDISPDHRPWKAKFVLKQVAANVLEGTIEVRGITNKMFTLEPVMFACDGEITLKRVDKVK